MFNYSDTRAQLLKRTKQKGFNRLDLLTPSLFEKDLFPRFILGTDCLLSGESYLYINFGNGVEISWLFTTSVRLETTSFWLIKVKLFSRSFIRLQSICFIFPNQWGSRHKVMTFGMTWQCYKSWYLSGTFVFMCNCFTMRKCPWKLEDCFKRSHLLQTILF